MGIFGRKKTESNTTAGAAAVATTPKQTGSQTGSQKGVAVKPMTMSVLVQPVVTEKSTVNGTYLFKVTSAATKSEIRKAFKAKYGKQPRKVNIVNVMGKTKLRGRTVGKRSNWKKAIIYLAQGETVDLYQ